MSRNVHPSGSQQNKAHARRLAMAASLAMVVATLSPLAVSTVRADATWTGATSQDWNNAANWSSNPAAPAGNLFVNVATGNYPILSANSTITPTDLILGDGAGQSGRLDQTSGTLSLLDTGSNGNWFFVGRNNGTGTYNITGDASLTVGKLFAGGGYFNPGGVGTITINTTGTVNANSNGSHAFPFGGGGFASVSLGVGDFGSNLGTGTLNMQAGTLNAFGEIWVGSHGGTGTLTQTGGTINTSGLVATKWRGAGTVSVSNGTLNAGFVNLTAAGAAGDLVTGSLTVGAGGTVNSQGDLTVASRGNADSTGTLTVETGGVINIATTTERWLIVNRQEGVRGTINVNGGTINLNANTDLRFSTNGSTAASVVNLNGGSINSYSGNLTGGNTSGVLDLNWNGAAAANNTFNLNGGTLAMAQVITSNNNATAAFNFNGGTLKATNNSANFVDLGGTTQVANVRNGGAIIDSNGYNVTVVQPLVHSAIEGDSATDGGLTKNGAGVLTLSGVNTYNGPTTVNAGGLVVSGSIASSTVVVAAGASFGAAGAATVSGLSFPGASTFTIDLGTAVAANPSVLNVTNALNVGGGTVTLNIGHTGPLNSGTYNLATLGSLTGTAGNLVLGTIQGLNSSRQTAQLNTSNTALTLTITGAVPIWRGSASTNWSTNTADKAWNVNGVDDYFINGDDVLFDDTASNPTVNVVGTVQPRSMTVNSTLNYTIQGAGTIAGTGTLTKLGSGSLTVANANTYSGGTTLSAGQLNVNNNTALGTGALTTTGAATIDNTSASPVTAANAVNLGGNLTFAGTRDLGLSGVISGNAQIVKTGTANLTLTGNNTYSAGTTINGGTVTVTAGTTGTTGSNIQIAPNTTDVGTLTVTGGTVNAGRVIIAGSSANDTSPGTGVLNQTGGTINSQAWFTVGSGGSATGNTGGNGTYNLSGGTLNVVTQQMEVGNFAGTTGTVNMSGSSAINIYNSNFISLGANNNATAGTFNQNGGAVTFYSDAGVTPGGNGILYLGRAGVLTGTYTYNLSGGTLTVPQISRVAGTGVFNFNGGTLKAARANASFMSGLSAANVQAGGAKIDTNGFDVTVAQALVHDAAGPAVDGGLTKSGAGVLTVTGVNTYTGPTTISGGTLRLPAGSSVAPVAVGSYSFDNILDGTTPVTSGNLNQGFTVKNDGSGGAAMDGTVNHADYLLGPDFGNLAVVAGKFGNGLQFDGLGSSVDIANRIVDQAGTANWTLSMWVQTSSPKSAMLSKNHGATSWESGDAVFYLASNPISPDGGTLPTGVRFGGGFVQGNQPVADGNWHLVTFVDNAGAKTVYVDGVAVALSMAGFDNADTTTTVRLGYNTNVASKNIDGTENFAGILDEMKFFSTALSPSQVASLYASNTVSVDTTQFLPANTPVNITASGATLDLNSRSQTVGSLAGVSGSAVTLGAGTLTTGGNGTSTSFAGAISGAGGVTKAGTGTWVLAGANTYAGPTAVSAGTLTVDGSLGNSNISIASAATLNGTGTLMFNLAGDLGDLITNAGTFNISGLDLSLNITGTQSLTEYVIANLSGGTLVGSAFASVLGLPAGGALDYDGTTAHPNAIVLTLGGAPVPGDADGDGDVDLDDQGIWAANFTGSLTAGSGTGTFATGDFDGDKDVDLDDQGIWAANFTGSLAPSGLAGVPEPASLSILGLGAVALTARRRRA